MSLHVAELEEVLKKLVIEHRRLLSCLDVQQAAMNTLNPRGIVEATATQETIRLRLLSLDTQRKTLLARIVNERKLASEPTLARLGELFPARAAELKRLRDELKALMLAVRERSQIGGRVARSVLGHLNSVLRMVANVVEGSGVYTRSGTPRVGTRVGMVEAVG